MEKQVYEFIANQSGEKIVERRKCKCGEEFAITDKDMEFYDKISPVFNGQKYSIPAPTLCPECRQKRRLVWRNERKLYKGKCNLTGKNIISMYPEDTEYKVYSLEAWWSDKRDAVDYGRDFDFSRTFFEQLGELILDVPQPNLSVLDMENSDYTNQSSELKNCYLIFNSNKDENCAYGRGVYNCVSLYDGLKCLGLTDSYECIDCYNSYKLYYSQECINCNNSYFLYGCKNCKDCYGGRNIDGKQYMFFDEQLSKNEYEKRLQKQLAQSIDIQKKQAKEQHLKYPIKYAFYDNSQNPFGDFITNSQNTTFAYDVNNMENSKYVTDCYGSNNLVDISTFGHNSSYAYYCTTMGINSSRLFFSADCWSDVNNIYYSVSCVTGSSNLFGCVGLRNKQYCIFNKQYTKEEYEELVPKIIHHMKNTGERGEFFPPHICQFCYNEGLGIEYFPLDREDAIKQGFKRQDKEYPINVPEGIELVKAQDLPENINDVSDEILKKAIVCEVSGKPFRIIKPELEFYRKHNLPLPRKHPDIRHLERLSKRAPRKLYLRTCDNCGKQVISVYPQDSEFKVYCEECYNKEIY